MKDVERAAESAKNENFEWAILKRLANKEGADLYHVREYLRDEKTREKLRRRGKKLLKIVGRMPDKLPSGEKIKKIDKMQRTAERIGLREDLAASLEMQRERFQDSLWRESSRLREQYGEEINEKIGEAEQERIKRLREKIVDLTNVEYGSLAEKFPSGTYLYHGSTVDNIEQIMHSGSLKNVIAMQGQTGEVGRNSGYEGISWSMNKIDALPGNSGHLAGFLAAPEDILSTNEKLVVPSRPAPYEVVQVSDGLDQEKAYRLKVQHDTWGTTRMSSRVNAVLPSLQGMYNYEPGDPFDGESIVYDYTGTKNAEDLRRYYEISNDGELTFNQDLMYSGMPAALPWMQSVLERGMLEETEWQGLKSVEAMIEQTRNDREFTNELARMAKRERAPVAEKYNEMLQAAEGIEVDVDKMYFVTSHRDVGAWLKIMAINEVEPKGILLYDDERVVLGNFASRYEGNQAELSEEIGNAIAVDEDFWRDEMGMTIDEIPRAGQRKHLLLESAIKHDKSVRVLDGKVVVE